MQGPPQATPRAARPPDLHMFEKPFERGTFWWPLRRQRALIREGGAVFKNLGRGKKIVGFIWRGVLVAVSGAAMPSRACPCDAALHEEQPGRSQH